MYRMNILFSMGLAMLAGISWADHDVELESRDFDGISVRLYQLHEG
jgi:hypothetical protein